MNHKHPRNYFNHVVLLLIIACLALATGCRAEQESQTRSLPSIQFESCLLTSPSLTINQEAQCSKLTVPEDPENPGSRQIDLKIAVIPAISRNPAPDPLFFLAGGPGEAATQSYLAVSGAFQWINQKRDIVLVDQRGTGGSHLLTCPNLTSETDTERTDPETMQALVSACLKEMDADPRLYTTSIAMADLDQVRQVLGYEKINLYGASYGTRAALVYARQYPEHVRAIILDGVAPPNWTLGPSAAQDAQRALELLFARCQADSACQAAYPDLRSEFQTVLDQLTDQPIEVSLDHPVTGEPTSFTLDRDTFANLVHTSTYSAEGAAVIPLMIHTAARRGDFSQLAAMALSNYALLEDTISQGMRFSVLCAEDVPYIPKQAASTGYLGDFFTTTFEQICSAWPKGEIPADFKQPVQSSVPALLLSGEADPVTPPANGELAAQGLPNSRHIIVPGQGHIVIYRGCIALIATTFIETGSVDGLDTACVQEIEPMPIFINVNGPTP